MSYLDMHEHLIKKCLTKQAQCPLLGCNKLLSDDIEAVCHFGVCAKAFIECEKCKLSLKRENDKTHTENICQEAEVKCRCTATIKRKELGKHDCVTHLMSLNESLNHQIKTLADEKRTLLIENNTLVL